MGFSDAIVARLGLDTASFRAGLLNAANQADAGAKRIASSLAAGKKSSDVLGDSIGGLGSALRIGGPLAAAAAIGGSLLKAAADAQEETRKLNEEIAKLTQGQGASDFRTFDGIKARLTEIDKHIDAIAAKAGKEGFWNGIGADISAAKDYVLSAGMLGGSGDVVGDREKREAALRKAKQSDLDDIAAKAKKINDIEESRIHGSERLAAIEKIRAEFDEKRSSTNDNPGARRELLRQQALAEEAINREFDAKERSIQAEERLNYIREKGLDVEERIAYAKLDQARIDQEAATSSEQKRAAGLKIAVAQTELKAAQVAATIRRSELAVALEIASLQATADEKRTRELQKQKELIEEKLRLAKESERPALLVDQQDNLNAIRDHEIALMEKAFAVAATAIDAQTGTGEANRLSALKKKSGLADDYVDHLKKSRDEDGAPIDPQTIADAEAYAKALRNEIEEIERSRKEIAETAAVETKIMEAQIRGQETLAGKLQAEERYRKAINQAIRDGNTNLADQLKAQQKLSTGQQSFEDWKKTPEQRQQERQGQRETARQQRAYEREVADVKSAMDRGVTGMTGRRGRIADDIRNGRIDPKNPLGASKTEGTLSEIHETLKRIEKKEVVNR